MNDFHQQQFKRLVNEYNRAMHDGKYLAAEALTAQLVELGATQNADGTWQPPTSPTGQSKRRTVVKYPHDMTDGRVLIVDVISYEPNEYRATVSILTEKATMQDEEQAIEWSREKLVEYILKLDPYSKIAAEIQAAKEPKQSAAPVDDDEKTMQYARDLRQAFTDPLDSPQEPDAVLYIHNLRGRAWRFKAWSSSTVWVETQPHGPNLQYTLDEWPVFDGQSWDYWQLSQLTERYLDDQAE